MPLPPSPPFPRGHHPLHHLIITTASSSGCWGLGAREPGWWAVRTHHDGALLLPSSKLPPSPPLLFKEKNSSPSSPLRLPSPFSKAAVIWAPKYSRQLRRYSRFTGSLPLLSCGNEDGPSFRGLSSLRARVSGFLWVLRLCTSSLTTLQSFVTPLRRHLCSPFWFKALKFHCP